MKIAVVGATGLVGTEILKVLAESTVPITQMLAVASAKSVGTSLLFKGESVTVISAEDAIALRPDVAIFSAGGATSLTLAPMFAAVGCRVIDNSSAWRQDETKKLIVPEINGFTLGLEDYIIANPNCSTIQMVMVLAPLHKLYTIKRVVVSTYQSVSGAGIKGVNQLNEEAALIGVSKLSGSSAFSAAIHQNLIPHIDVFTDNGYTKEEMKMANETIKIMGDASIKVSATCVRVPVMRGHSEAINIEFEKDFDLDTVISTLRDTAGVDVYPTETHQYPTPKETAHTNGVHVGRIRRDISTGNGLALWVVSDNLRKGAATNAVQILEYMHGNALLN